MSTTACPMNVWNHTNGCDCATKVGGGVASTATFPSADSFLSGATALEIRACTEDDHGNVYSGVPDDKASFFTIYAQQPDGTWQAIDDYAYRQDAENERTRLAADLGLRSPSEERYSPDQVEAALQAQPMSSQEFGQYAAMDTRLRRMQGFPTVRLEDGTDVSLQVESESGGITESGAYITRNRLTGDEQTQTHTFKDLSERAAVGQEIARAAIVRARDIDATLRG